MNEKLIKYLLLFLIFFVVIYTLYYFFVVNPQIRLLKGKTKITKRKKNLPTEIILLRDYYKIDINKIGLIKILRILNFINALILSLLVLVVIPIDKVYLKIAILVILILPTIWFTYYFIAKYLKFLERKDD